MLSDLVWPKVITLSGAYCTSNNLNFDFTEEESDREEMKKDFFKCERRLRRVHLELATLEHETLGNRRSAFQMLRTLRSEETEVRDLTRSVFFIDREADKFAAWIRTMENQV
jgi:hypothetical protein